MTATETKPQVNTSIKPDVKQPWLWNVVLLNDDDHSVEYVIKMMKELFAHPEEKGLQIAKQVDRDERAVVLTTHKEHAELKQEQVHAYGRDEMIAGCAGAMSAIIEPAYADGDEGADDRK